MSHRIRPSFLSRKNRARPTVVNGEHRGYPRLAVERLEARCVPAVLIDNDIPTGTLGQFSYEAGAGGNTGTAVGLTQGGITVQGRVSLISNQNFFFLFENYVDVGSNGGAVALGNTTVTQQATLTGDDTVTSSGTFAGPNGTISWTVETSIPANSQTMRNQVSFSSSQSFGNVRFINYIDQDVEGISDDILVPNGRPGTAGFRAFTLDNAQRVGFAQSGIYSTGATGLTNASYDGWAADRYSNLVDAITGAGTTYSVNGNINTNTLQPFLDPVGGQAYGLADVTTAFAWTLNPNATTSVVTTFLDSTDENALRPGSPTQLTVTGTDVGAAPHVKVFNDDGSLRLSFYAYDDNFFGGVRVAAGDINNDDVLDIITSPGPGGGPNVKAYDGTTGELLRSFYAYDAGYTVGIFVGSADINGDGFDDIITGPDAGGGPNVKVFSGQNGAELMSFYAFDPSFLGGVRVAGGNLSADTFDDVAVSAGAGGGPNVKVFSGFDSSELSSFYAYAPEYAGGVYIAVGDVNPSSVFDEIITGTGNGGTPNVKVFTGPEVLELLDFFPYQRNFVAGVRVAAVDVTQDGRPEIVTGQGPNSQPVVLTIDAVTTDELDAYFAYSEILRTGIFVGGR